MTASLVTLSPSTSVRDAIRLIEDMEIRHLPVVEEGQLVGIVSDRDLRPLPPPDDTTPLDPSWLDRTVSDIMTREVISVDVTEDLGVAVDVMLRYGVGAVPAVDPETGGLMGIISYVDVLRAVRPSL